jgi:hypothetical protein
MGEDRTGPYKRRLTVARAADALGISAEAVRGRIRRGTLRTEKDSGTVYVLLDRTYGDRTRPTGDRTAHPDALVLQMQARIESLERQLMRHGDETERLHQIIAGLAQANAEQARTIRAIEAPASEEPAEALETVEEEPERAEPRSDAAGPQAGAQRPQTGGLRNLRRRILGW